MLRACRAENPLPGTAHETGSRRGEQSSPDEMGCSVVSTAEDRTRISRKILKSSAEVLLLTQRTAGRESVVHAAAVVVDGT